MPIVQAQRLHAWTGAVFQACGVSPEHAATVADLLVDTSLRGIDTHGVSRIPAYVELLARGRNKAQPQFKIIERKASLEFDADFSLGQVAGMAAVDAAYERAKSLGFAFVTIRNTGHLGALGYFTRHLAEKGMLACLMQNAPPLMALPGFKRRAIGNNPLSFAAPVEGSLPFVFDMAASEAAFGKIIEAKRDGKSIPDGWALDKDGNPTNDSAKAFEGMLLPTAGAKGMGIAMMVECLAGGFTGTDPSKLEGVPGLPAAFGGFLMVINPYEFQDGPEFDAHMRKWVQFYRASGADARYPGERRAEVAMQRSKDGIPVSEDLDRAFAAVAEKAGVPL